MNLFSMNLFSEPFDPFELNKTFELHEVYKVKIYHIVLLFT